MKRISFFLFTLTVFLSFLGLFLLYESSSYAALNSIGDKYFFVKYQIIWIIAGISFSVFISRLEYKKLYNFSLPLLVFSLFLLLIVFIPGIGLSLKGSHRWINLKYFVFQPSELLKISLSLYLAAWLSGKEKNRTLAFLILFFASIILVVIEPDMGTAIIIGVSSLIVYFLAGTRILEILFVLVILFLMSFILIKIEPYRIARFNSFANFDINSIETAPYHMKQILLSLGAGGLTGLGFGKSIEKYSYLPENTTDSIFAIFAEEAGYIGTIFLLGLFLYQIFLGFLIAMKTQDAFGRLLACGITTFLGVQTFLNLASQAIIVPITGVPLPFISYGGSSMLINFISIGILLNISNHTKE